MARLYWGAQAREWTMSAQAEKPVVQLLSGQPVGEMPGPRRSPPMVDVTGVDGGGAVFDDESIVTLPWTIGETVSLCRRDTPFHGQPTGILALRP